MTNFLVRAYCAGITVFEKKVPDSDLAEFMNTTKESWKQGAFTISFGTGQTQSVSELCLDVFEAETHTYHYELSQAFK